MVRLFDNPEALRDLILASLADADIEVTETAPETWLAIATALCNGEDWENVTTAPNSGAGLDRSVTTIVRQVTTGGSAHPVTLWLKVGTGATQWINLGIGEPNDHKVAFDHIDTAPDFLIGKLQNGQNLLWTLSTVGGVRRAQGNVLPSSITPTQVGGTSDAGASGEVSDALHMHAAADPAVDGSFLFTAKIVGTLWGTGAHTTVGGYAWPFPTIQWGGGGFEETHAGSCVWNSTRMGSLLDLSPAVYFNNVEPFLHMRFLAWYDSSPGERAKQYGLYEISDMGSASTYAQFRRASDADDPADFVNGKCVVIAGGIHAGHVFRYVGPTSPTFEVYGSVVGDELPFSDLGIVTPPSGDKYEALTTRQLVSEGASSATIDMSVDNTGPGAAFPYSFETLSLGVAELPAGPYGVRVEGISLGHLWPNTTTTLKLVIRDLDTAGTPTILEATPLLPITNETPQALTFQGELLAPYAFGVAKRLLLSFEMVTDSTSPVVMTIRFNSANRGTWLKLPFALFAAGTDDHQLLTLASRSPDVAAGEPGAHPAKSIGRGRMQSWGGVGSVDEDGILTFPADANHCTITGSGTISGINPTGWLQDAVVSFFIEDAGILQPSVAVTHKAFNAATRNAMVPPPTNPGLPFWLPPLPGFTAGNTLDLDMPTTVTCRLDIAAGCVRLVCPPTGSVNT